MIRLLIIAIPLVLFFLISLPIMLIFLIVRLFSKKACDYISLRWVQLGLWLADKITGMRYEVKGKENIATDEAVLYVGNHLSIFDILVLYPQMKKTTGFVAKKEINKVPILNLLMRFTHCIFLDRKDPRDGLRMVMEAADLIKGGTSVFLFPEGTRSKDGEMLDFKTGSFKIVEKTHCKVVPVRIDYEKEVFEDHLPKFYANKAHVKFFEAIDTSDMDKHQIKDLAVQVHDLLKEEGENRRSGNNLQS